MLLPIYILCLSHLILAIPLQPEYDVEDIEQLEYHFNDFKVKYNKSYTAEEESLKFQHFKENLVKINELNRKYYPITVYGINEFADWTEEEMQTLFGFDGANLGDDDNGLCSIGVVADIKSEPVADHVDWREQNAVTPVQNQQTCGSCWTFSAAAVLEGAYALKHKTLLKLSEQQFLDCDTKSHGCKGGLPHLALSSTMELGGQEAENDYPYRNKQQQCQFVANKAQVRVNSCTMYPRIGDRDGKLASLLASAGPLSIALDASQFLTYNGGIIHDCGASRMNHAVTLVGYGEEGGIPYWIIKNSWGTGWGENGYARVKKGVGCMLVGGYVLSADVA